MIFGGESPTGRDVQVSRQPVFDRDKNVYAYELLFKEGFHQYASGIDLESATIKVISNSLIIGLKKLTGDKKAFINFNEHMLVSRIPRLFPAELLAVEVLEALEPEDLVIDACIRLKSAGYPFVVGDFAFKEQYEPFLKLADIVKVDFHASTSRQRFVVLDRVKSLKTKVLAERVETQGHFEEALELGFDYFQGFFFQKPEMIQTRVMPGFKVNYLEILKLVCEPDFPFTEVETILKRDVSLTYKLLRFINSAAYGFRVSIRSIRHAMLLLGKREIRKWLTLIALSGTGGNKPRELLQNTLIRARFCELIGKDLRLGGSQNVDLFLIGMFSMADAFLDRGMDEILEELPLDEAIKGPLSGVEGLPRDILDLVVAYEKAQWEEADRIAKKIKLGDNMVVSYYVEAVHWVREF